MTMGPGDMVWERFGHNALWIHDARTGQDVVWNWGIFSFDQVGFIPRLVRGHMLYAMYGFTLDSTLEEYRRANRPVWVQELALTPEQEAELDRFVRINAQPENRDYRYDYYRDNCSTRVRDALDLVLGGAIRARYEGEPTGVTWRWHTLRLLEGLDWAWTGIQVVLGNPGDETIDRWQEMFLPMKLREHVAAMEVVGPDGRARPLVVAERQLLESSRGPAPTEPRHRVVGFLLAGLAAAGLLALLTVAGGRGHAWARRAAGAGVLLWGVVSGVAGALLLGAYLTDHVFWYGNENLFHLSPLGLAVAALAGLLLVRGRAPRGAGVLGRLVAALSLLGLVLKVLPAMDQANLEIVALALPLNLAVAFVFFRLRPGAVRAASPPPR